MVSTFELSEWLGVSNQRIREMARAGLIPTITPGRYKLKAAVRAWADWQRTSRPGMGSQSLALTAAKTRAAEATADKLELHNQAARRELIAASDVERAWATVLRDVRAGMLSVPSRVQQRMGHLTKHDILAIDAEIRTALSEAAHAE
ncbi:hypothetical protein [Rhodomicrobium vannielii]|uniref:hypothetical protein n=1 Tax=Rhodomicrobium vannielii TaxID=1069 RepID=UPI0002E7AB0B|nr:hypothetical protein [Rhodomicrobium vannielii]